MQPLFEFDAAIAAHKTWLKRLEYFVAGIEPEGLDLTAVSDPTACALGQWLSGDGSRFSQMHNFSQLVATHKLFHELADEVVTLAVQGKSEEAEVLLEGQVANLSMEIALILESMKRDHRPTKN